MWREKAIKWAWYVLFLNAFVSITNVGFTYGHYLKHQYWPMAFSIFLVLANGFVAVWQYRRIKQMNVELKQLTWQILQGRA